MLLSQLFAPFVILEAKARIEHPEDLVFDNGLRGAKTALQILQTTAEQPQSVSIKFDGSPALIYGWRGDEFILTDKAGFGAKGYDGMTTSAKSLHDMLMGRKQKDTSPEAMERRSKYSQTIASLYPILKSAVPKSFEGYAQGDLLWVGVPPIVDGMYEFKPNKIVYRIPVDSDLGKQIAKSRVGMVVHSVFYSQQDQEPEALRDVASLGWKVPGKLVVVPHEIEFSQQLRLNEKFQNQLKKVLAEHGTGIEQLFNSLALADLNIKAFPGLLKSFVAYKAGKGDDDYSHAPEEFVTWLMSPASKASAKMQQSVTDWIRQNIQGYNAVWLVVELLTLLKLDLKNQMDAQVGNLVSAHLEDKPGHEGFVSVTDQGIIKLVNRAEFMKKDELKEQISKNGNKHVAWTFGRANPPTLGHQQLVDTVAKNAKGGDYWIFLSHSQDPKKNPLPYSLKKHFAQQIMPQHADHFDVPDDIRTFLQAADWLYKQGYRSMTFVAGSDRLPAYKKSLADWNSASIREKAPLMIDGEMQIRDPMKINFASAGERDPDAEGLSGISGTKARLAVADDDLAAFQASTGLSGKLARSMFDSVKSHMNAPKAKPTKKLQEDEDHSKGTVVKLRLANECAQQLYEWCQDQNINCLDPYDFHMTLVFSKTPAPQLANLNATSTHVPAQIKGWKILGENALVLDLHSPVAEQMHKRMLECGASHSYPDFIPHNTVVYGWNDSRLPKTLPPMELVYEMVEVEPLDPDWGVVRKA